jgi:predicted MFS family arabinose efflux permease
MFAKLRKTFAEYPRQFWLLMAAVLIDMTGGFLIFPFFSLYFTEKFSVGLTQVGVIYGIWSLTGILGNAAGGALTDRAGRKRMVIYGLVFSALSSLGLALAPTFFWVYITAAIGGLFSSISRPAHQAMVADILPKEQYSDGFGIIRVVGNVAFAIGPAIGGLLASVSYVLLFVIDAISSILAALFIARYLKESQSKESAENVGKQSMAEVFRGYLDPLKDFKLIAVILLGGLVGLVYFQWYFALPVFMRDVHGFAPSIYGGLMSFAGVLVIVFQLPLTRSLKRVSAMALLALGSLLFAIGFGLFAFISALALFVLAFTVITFGEMIFFPTQHSLVARLAPEDLRGRYMAVAGLAFALPNMVGPTLAGLLLDRADPNMLWYLGTIICLLALFGYLALRGRFADLASEEAAEA